MPTIIYDGVQPSPEWLTIEEDNTTVIISNGSIIGGDNYSDRFFIYNYDYLGSVININGTMFGAVQNYGDCNTTIGESGYLFGSISSWRGAGNITNYGEIRGEYECIRVLGGADWIRNKQRVYYFGWDGGALSRLS